MRDEVCPRSWATVKLSTPRSHRRDVDHPVGQPSQVVLQAYALLHYCRLLGNGVRGRCAADRGAAKNSNSGSCDPFVTTITASGLIPIGTAPAFPALPLSIRP